MAQPGDGNKPSTSGKETSIPVSELRATITEMLKQALGDHKADKGKQKSANPEGRFYSRVSQSRTISDRRLAYQFFLDYGLG